MGAAIVASRFAVAEVPPLTLAMLRYAIGFCCLLPFAWKQWPVVPRGDMGAMAALGIGQFGILIALLNFGLQHVDAAQAALIFSLFPLLTLLLAAAMGRESVSWALIAGVCVSIAGVALALTPKLGMPQGGHWWGELAVLGAACTGALWSVLYRPYLQRYPTLPVSALAMLASVLFLALIALGEDWPARLPTFGVRAWAAITFIGVSSGIGYYWWLYALRHESPTRVTVFLALNPVTAALLGWGLLGETLPLVGLGALVLIAAGLWLATRPSQAR